MRESTQIKNLSARKIFNSRGEETIEVDIQSFHHRGRSSAPSGKSRGIHEAVPYPQGGVDEAVDTVKDLIKPRLVGLESLNQKAIDKILHKIDNTPNFKKLGGNTTYAVSLAAISLAASIKRQMLFQYIGKNRNLRLPHPLGNVLNGGKHAGKGTPDIQEYLTLPVKAKSFIAAFAANVKIHKRVGDLLKKKIPSFTEGRGDEGGWAPTIDNEGALTIVTQATEEITQETGTDVRVGLDVAASSFWRQTSEKYHYSRDKKRRARGEQIEYIRMLTEKYRLAYVEDPLHEEDFEGFAELSRKTKNCLICGDDLFVTNKNRLKKGIKLKTANALIIKPNQIGTLTDTFQTVELAKKHKYTPVISHRSGETADPSLSHLAVGLGCPIIKTGILGGERIAKLNELIRIEEYLKGKASLAKLKI